MDTEQLRYMNEVSTVTGRRPGTVLLVREDGCVVTGKEVQRHVEGEAVLIRSIIVGQGSFQRMLRDIIVAIGTGRSVVIELCGPVPHRFLHFIKALTQHGSADIPPELGLEQSDVQLGRQTALFLILDRRQVRLIKPESQLLRSFEIIEYLEGESSWQA